MPERLQIIPANQSFRVEGIHDIFNPDRTYSLTVRQLQIYALRAKGMTSDKIADALGISCDTVNNTLRAAVYYHSGDTERYVPTIVLLLAAEYGYLLTPQAQKMFDRLYRDEISIDDANTWLSRNGLA